VLDNLGMCEVFGGHAAERYDPGRVEKSAKAQFKEDVLIYFGYGQEIIWGVLGDDTFHPLFAGH
jgi:hypothetical protein